MSRPTAARGITTAACRSCSGARAWRGATVEHAGRDGRHHADAGSADRPCRSLPARSTAIAWRTSPATSSARAKHLKTRDFSFMPFRHEGTASTWGRALRALGRGSDAQAGSRAGAGGAASRSTGCVQTRQYADVQFTPPQGDYKLLVLRPDVTVGSLTTGGMVEPRADWTDQARAKHRRRASRAAGGARRQRHDHRASQRASRRRPRRSSPTSSG